MEMKVAKYISDFLVKQGVTDCFLVTGGGAMHLNDALGHQEGLHCVFNHHEQASSIAAEGYARYHSGAKPAVVCVIQSDQIFKVLPIFLRFRSYKWIKKLTK